MREPGRPHLNIVHSPQERLRRGAHGSQVTSALFELSTERLPDRGDNLRKSMPMCEIGQLLLGKWLLQHIQRGGAFRMIRWMESIKRVRSGGTAAQLLNSFKPTTLFYRCSFLFFFFKKGLGSVLDVQSLNKHTGNTFHQQTNLERF